MIIASRRQASESHKASSSQSFSHINIQERVAVVDGPQNTVSDTGTFVRKSSLQKQIEDGLLYTDASENPKEPLDRPLTFAEATMSTTNKDLKDGVAGDATLGSSASMDSLGTSKVILKRKKKFAKWSPFDLSTAANNGGEAGSGSEAGSSRAASPSVQPAVAHASHPFASWPQHSFSTLAATSIGPPMPDDSDRDNRETGFASQNAGDSLQTPTQGSYEFSALPAQHTGERPLFDTEEPASQSTDESLQTPIPSDDGLRESIARVSALFSARNLQEAAIRLAAHNSHIGRGHSPSSDTQSTQAQREAAMTSIVGAFGTAKPSRPNMEDPFDSLEWDPDMPSVSASDSPEPVQPAVVVPQPRAYTTVGSLVDPNAVPQFTAPNRIQREGAGRRPLLTFMQNRQSTSTRHPDSAYYAPRNLPASLTMAESMHFAQRVSQSPKRDPELSSSHSSRSATRQPDSLTEEDLQLLRKAREPQVEANNANVFGYTSFRDLYKRQLASNLSETRVSQENTSPSKSYYNQDLTLATCLPADLLERDHEKSMTLSGLEKMQTLQRLAKFNNPAQSIAKQRLNALSVRNNSGKTVANPSGLPNASSTSARGELDRSYQFPPPGFDPSSTSQPNPLLNAYGGRPQPLTAGPPGQRQYLAPGVNRSFASINGFGQFEGEAIASDPVYSNDLYRGSIDPRLWSGSSSSVLPNPLSQNFISPIQPSTWKYREPAFPGEHVGSNIVDTASIPTIAKYYPHGIDETVSGNYEPLPYQTMVKMGHVPGEQEPRTVAEKKAAWTKELGDQLYEGQRRYGMTTEDHIDVLDWQDQKRKAEAAGALGAIGPRPKITIEKKPITPEEMENMTVADAAKPLVAAAFGRLLAFADGGQDCESSRYLSGFTEPDDYLVDDSEHGNKSFFGEDWGAPRQRRDKGRGVASRVSSAAW